MDVSYLLNNWCKNNIIGNGDEIMLILTEQEMVTCDSIENYYEELNMDYFESIEEYNDAYLNLSPKEVVEWLLVTDEGYNKLKRIGLPVLKFKTLNFYGRTSENDFNYIEFDKIKIILDIN